MDFPNSPSVGTTASNGASTWTWNGKQWDITGSVAISAPMTVSQGGTGVTTLTGLAKGNGVASFTAAVPGTDYVATAADVLAKLVTVDGVGSGLDADLLDGQSGAYYTPPPLPLSVANGGTSGTTQATALAGLSIPRHNLLDVQDIAPHNLLRITAAGGLAALQLNKAAGANSNFLQGLMATKPRWLIYLGDSTAESGSNAGSDFSIWRYDDAGNAIGKSLEINRGSGNAMFPNIQASIIGGGAASAEMNIFPAYHYINGGPGWPTLNGGMIAIRGNTSGNFSSGAITCYSGSGSTGVTLGNAAQSWGGFSDERLKNIVGEITDGLKAILAIRPIRYRFKTDESDFPIRVGLTAQSILPHIPEAVDEVPLIGPDGKATAEKYLQLRMTDLIPHLINAIQELAGRLKVLEGK